MHVLLSYCKEMMAKQMEVQPLKPFKTRLRSVSLKHFKTFKDALEPHLTRVRSIYNNNIVFNLLYCLMVALNIMFKMKL